MDISTEELAIISSEEKSTYVSELTVKKNLRGQTVRVYSSGIDSQIPIFHPYKERVNYLQDDPDSFDDDFWRSTNEMDCFYGFGYTKYFHTLKFYTIGCDIANHIFFFCQELIGWADVLTMKDLLALPKYERICPNNTFMCNSSEICINNIYICDAVVDCPMGEDEENCPEHFIYFECSSTQKISHQLVCNHVNDCENWLDEAYCGET
ncbi:DgyrCDS9721 [Dimorphilus gyrociliatus]|uniref:DgyrCDS9721 n=1 Tax=Dimorphilus gyrociliatus TaxID=2664684 RepID=A0A7I8VY69_9ANNE|nr:DgyrCDS9721 [Dimorphilus gyrociliatus]